MAKFTASDFEIVSPKDVKNIDFRPAKLASDYSSRKTTFTANDFEDITDIMRPSEDIITAQKLNTAPKTADNVKQVSEALPTEIIAPVNYGLRTDGTPKGSGWLGELKRPDGRVSTEMSIGVNIDGKDSLIPTLVPTLDKTEIDYLLKTPEDKIDWQSGMGKTIVQKAVAFAEPKIKEGESPFKETEKQKDIVPMDKVLSGTVAGGATRSFDNKETALDRLKYYKSHPEYALPFVQDIDNAVEIGKVFIAANKLKDGKELNETEAQILEEFVNKSKKDRTWGAQVVDILGMLPGYAGEFALTGGIYTAGKTATKSALKETAEWLLKEDAEKLLKNKVAQIAGKSVAAIGGGTLQSLGTGAVRIPADIAKQMTPDFTIKYDESGNPYGEYKQGKEVNIITATSNALANEWVQTVSEHSGDLPGTLWKAMPEGKITNAITKAFSKINPVAKMPALQKFAEQTAFHGAWGEMFEERIAELGNWAIGNGYQMPSGSQITAELVGFSIPSLLGVGISKIAGNKQPPEGGEPVLPTEPETGGAEPITPETPPAPTDKTSPPPTGAETAVTAPPYNPIIKAPFKGKDKLEANNIPIAEISKLGTLYFWNGQEIDLSRIQQNKVENYPGVKADWDKVISKTKPKEVETTTAQKPTIGKTETVEKPVEVKPIKKPTPKAKDLKEEAKKYKTAEEFVNSQIGNEKEIPQKDRPIVYEADIEGMAEGLEPYKKEGNISFYDDGSSVIAKIDDKEVGYINKLSDSETEISVAVEHQRKGIGTKLSTEFNNRYPEMKGKLGGLTPQGKGQITKQLTDIWNEANKPVGDKTTPTEKAKEPDSEKIRIGATLRVGKKNYNVIDNKDGVITIQTPSKRDTRKLSYSEFMDKYQQANKPPRKRPAGAKEVINSNVINKYPLVSMLYHGGAKIKDIEGNTIDFAERRDFFDGIQVLGKDIVGVKDKLVDRDAIVQSANEYMFEKNGMEPFKTIDDVFQWAGQELQKYYENKRLGLPHGYSYDTIEIQKREKEILEKAANLQWESQRQDALKDMEEVGAPVHLINRLKNEDYNDELNEIIGYFAKDKGNDKTEGETEAFSEFKEEVAIIVAEKGRAGAKLPEGVKAPDFIRKMTPEELDAFLLDTAEREGVNIGDLEEEPEVKPVKPKEKTVPKEEKTDQTVQDEAARTGVPLNYQVGDRVLYPPSIGIIQKINDDGTMQLWMKDTPKGNYIKVRTKDVKPFRDPDIDLSEIEDSEYTIGLKTNKARLIEQIGMNQYSGNMASVGVKELTQNSFDAIKEAYYHNVLNGRRGDGVITVDINTSERTISITDNGIGMDRDILQNAFFTIAGTHKDMPIELQSGGFGQAKLSVFTGAEWVKVETSKNGEKLTAQANKEQILNDDIRVKAEKVSKNAHGSTVTIKIPESVYDANSGSNTYVSFPYSIDNIDFLEKPLLGDVEVRAKFNSEESFIVPIGKNQDLSQIPLVTDIHFDWGDGQLYFGNVYNPNTGYYNRPKHTILSSGVYQFDTSFNIRSMERIPYDIIIDIRPKVRAGTKEYPFTNNRESFKSSAQEDINALTKYLVGIAQGFEASNIVKEFNRFTTLQKIESQLLYSEEEWEQITKAAEERHAKEQRASKDKIKLEDIEIPKEVIIGNPIIKEGGIDTNTYGTKEVRTTTGKIIVEAKSSFRADKELPVIDEYLLKADIDHTLPLLHNNTSADFIEAGRNVRGRPGVFFSQLGSIFMEIKDVLSKSDIWGMDKLQGTFFIGTSIDKSAGYAGVFIRAPINGAFLNPLIRRFKTPQGMMNCMVTTIIHELAHAKETGHGVEHNQAMWELEEWLADKGYIERLRDDLQSLFAEHWDAIQAMRGLYEQTNTRNIGKTFAESEGFKVAESGRIDNVGGNKQGLISERERQGRGTDLSRDTGGTKQSQERRGATGETLEPPTKYSATMQLSKANITLDDIKEMLPGMDKYGQDSEGNFWIETNGIKVKIYSVEEIKPNEYEFKLGYLRSIKPGERIAGAYTNKSIYITKFGDKWTIPHEQWHMVKDLGITSEADNQAMRRATAKSLSKSLKDTTEEDEATYFANERKKRAEDRNSLTKHIIQKILDFIDGLVNLVHRTARGVIRDIESGKINQKQARTERKAETVNPDIRYSTFRFSDTAVQKQFAENKGMPKEKLLDRIKSTIGFVLERVSRDFEHLPEIKENAELLFKLRNLAKQRGIVGDKISRQINGITEGLDSDHYDMFGKKIILMDFMETSQEGKILPGNLTLPQVMTALAELNQFLDNNPESKKLVESAINKRNAVWDTIKPIYLEAMRDIGYLSGENEFFTREYYFRHQVIDYMNIRPLLGIGKKLRTPTGRSFAKTREGGELAINMEYIQAEYEVMAQMTYDIEVAKLIKWIDTELSITKDLQKQAKEWNDNNPNDLITWKEFIPEGYSVFQPRKGNIFYNAQSIPDEVVSQLITNSLMDLGLTEDVIKPVLAMGTKFRELTIKNEVAETLENLSPEQLNNSFLKAAIITDRVILRAWKQWQLISPRRFLKYNIRNLTGDTEAAYVGNPKVFSKVPQAINQLYRGYKSKNILTGDLADWMGRGGQLGTLQAQEMDDLKQLFPEFIEDKSLKNIAKKPFSFYWKAARLTTDFRENILRYAAYLEYLEDLTKNNGKPTNYGASNPKYIDGLSDIKDKAYALENDLLGAYDKVSVFGQWFRQHGFPFWSWKEVNAKRYYRLLLNAPNFNGLAKAVAVKMFGTAVWGIRAVTVGRFVLSALALLATTSAWNILFMGDEEDDLPERERETPHIIFGRTKDGEVIYFNRIGMIGDILDWFNLSAALPYINDMFRGRASLRQTVKKLIDNRVDVGIGIIKAPVNVLIQGSLPFSKLAAELISRRSWYPDVTKPSVIRDRALYTARSLGMENEFIALTGKPSRGYLNSLVNLALYKIDPLESAYFGILQKKYEFLKKEGKGMDAFYISPKGSALYNTKLAIRYKDQKAAGKYMKIYELYGGNIKSLNKSFIMMAPEYGLNAQERNKFEESLSEQEKEMLDKANTYFQFLYEDFKNTIKNNKTSNQKETENNNRIRPIETRPLLMRPITTRPITTRELKK